MNVTHLRSVRLLKKFLEVADKEGWEENDFAQLLTDETKRREILLYLRGERYTVMPKHVADRLMWGSLFSKRHV
jgi:hypothetical protein